MSKLAKIKQDNPDLDVTEEIITVSSQIDQLHAIKSFSDTEGGKELVNLLMVEVRDNVLRLGSVYKTATLVEMQALIADIDSKLSLAKLILGANDSKKVLEEQLEEALRE